MKGQIHKNIFEVFRVLYHPKEVTATNAQWYKRFFDNLYDSKKSLFVLGTSLALPSSHLLSYDTTYVLFLTIFP